MIENTFLAVNKQYLGIGLKSIDILIIAQIEEFERNNCQCYITNKQFADIFGESESTIKRAIDKLDEFNVIERHTTFIEGNGRSNRQRILSLNNYKEWKVQFEPTKMEGPNVDDGRFKNEEWKGHSGPIKDNIKDKEKDNMAIIRNIWDYISFEEEMQEDIELGLLLKSELVTDKVFDFINGEFDRLGSSITFIMSYDIIESYKNGKCMGSCHITSCVGGMTNGGM